MQSVIAQAKKLGKSVYLFSIDSEQGKVAHVNFVAEDAKAKGLDGRTWANAISEVLGGKVSGRYSRIVTGILIYLDRLEERRMVHKVSE